MDDASDPTNPRSKSWLNEPIPKGYEGYCLQCQERLFGSRCRKCGREFDWKDASTYLKRPRFSAVRFWFPGFCLAVASGVISYAFVLQTGEMGFALFVSVPVSFGAIIGFATNTTRFVTVLLGLVALLGVLFALVTFNLASFFCGATVGVLFLVPLFSGIFLGVLLREVMRNTRWDHRRYLPIIFLLLIPYGCEWIENSLHRQPITATVETGLTIDATPEEAWQALMFYEDVTHSPPWLLKLALPKPIRSEGRKSQVGDVVRCIYDRGRLCKQVTSVTPPRKMEFDVVEQQIRFEHDVKLAGGSFEFLPVAPHKTRVLLTTRYQRWCWPEWYWGSIERKVIHTLHEHVIRGIELEAQERRMKQPPETQPPTESSEPVAMMRTN